MPRNTYGYDSYRGRAGSRRVLTGIIVVLLLLLVLAVAAFFLLQKYMVYTDDGQVRLELPFFHAETSPTPTPAESESIVIVTAQPTPTPTPEPTPPAQPVITAVRVTRRELLDGTAAQVVAEAGGNAALLDMKADDGSLGYVSALADALRLGTSAADPTLNDAVAQLRDAGLYTVARVSCFKDHTAPMMNNRLAIKTNSGYNWRDETGSRWMNVSVPAARQYVADVIAELAGLGFDEILLEHSGYPIAGNLTYIKVGDAYDPDNLSAPVEEFYQAVAAALADTDTRLSIAVSPALLTGEGDLSGITPELLGQYADRVYVPAPAEGEDYAPGLAAAGLEETDLVTILPADTDPADTDPDDTVSQLLPR